MNVVLGRGQVRDFGVFNVGVSGKLVTAAPMAPRFAATVLMAALMPASAVCAVAAEVRLVAVNVRAAVVRALIVVEIVVLPAAVPSEV